MGTKHRLSKPPAERILKLSLWESFNTSLHRAGLAGLYMALKHLEPLNGKAINWELASDSIHLNWTCTDREALTWLLDQTYKLDDQGIIKIPALGSIETDTKIAIHNGIISTFLQHPKSVESVGIKSRNLEKDEYKSIEVKYKELRSYNYQTLKSYNHQDLNGLSTDNKKKQDSRKKLYDSQGYFEPFIRIVSWLYPGATDKHVALGGATELQESPAGFISLLFAPIACSYYQVRSRLFSTKYRWALIIPQIQNLETFAEIRQTKGFQVVSYDNYFASGVSDASLRHLMAVATSKTAAHQKVPTCDVWAFGDVAWSQQQSITSRKTVELSPELREQYELCELHLENGVKVGKNGTFIDVSFGREIAAENLVQGKPWYRGLHDVLKFNYEIFGLLNYERKNLRNMNEAMSLKQLTPKMATLFGDAFTWQLRERFREVRRSTSSGKANYDKVRTDLLMSIRNCRSQHDFVKLQTLVFSRPTSSRNPFLQGIELGEFYLWMTQYWQDCLSLMTLSIVGYQDPWQTPRTAAILESKGLKRPKSKDLIKVDSVDDSSEQSEPDEEESPDFDEPMNNPLLDEN